MRAVVCAAALVFGLAESAVAQVVPLGPAFRVNAYTTLPQGSPHVANDAAGNVVVVWQSGFQDGSGWGVFSRRYDAGGAPLGPEFQVNTYTTSHQERAAVAADPAGNCAVVWSSIVQGPDVTNDVHAQRFDTAGNRLGAEFQVNSADHGWDDHPSIASSSPAGGLIVVWDTVNRIQHEDNGLFGRRFDPTGTPVGADFQIDTYQQGLQAAPHVASDDGGGFLVAWSNVATGGHGDGFFVRRNTAGQFAAAEVQASSCPEADPFRRFRPSVAHLGAGRFVVAWPQPAFGNSVRAQVFSARGAPATREVSLGGTTVIDGGIALAPDGPDRFTAVWRNSSGIVGRVFNADLVPTSAQFLVDSSGSEPATTRQGNDTFLVAWTGATSASGIQGQRFGGLRSELEARDLAVDGGGNGVLEVAETAAVAPGWRNPTAAPIAVSGVLVGFTGPPGPTYTVVDPVAQYLVPPGQRADCTATGDCHSVSISASSRPAQHWDAVAEEILATGTRRSWAFHVGDSFADVPRTRAEYRFVEGLLHAGVTGGCTGATYCPDDAISREQMAVFLRVGREGPSACPPGACRAGAEVFPDVPAASAFCPWIEELSRFGVASGCGGGAYCPTAPVTREQMAVFVLATREGSGYQPPACIAGSERFADVPASSPYCRWIEELARRNVVTGCGGGLYCPAANVTRGQMAVFVGVTFGLPLYGP